MVPSYLSRSDNGVGLHVLELTDIGNRGAFGVGAWRGYRGGLHGAPSDHRLPELFNLWLYMRPPRCVAACISRSGWSAPTALAFPQRELRVTGLSLGGKKLKWNIYVARVMK